MNIVIASSQPWFTLDDHVAAQHKVSYITDDAALTSQHLEILNPDVIFFPHWNWKVSAEIFGTYQCIVFHTAPLPYGRGGSPIQNLILDGHKDAPVCALAMTDELDAGPIYATKTISLDGKLSDIFTRINDAVNSLIAELVSGDLPQPTPQSGQPHYFKRRGGADNEIPADADLNQVFDRIRMLDDANYPKSYIIHGDYKIELSGAEFDGDSITAACKITKC